MRAERDLAFHDPWLIRRRGGVAVFVMHESSGAVFHSHDAGGGLAFEGFWRDYAPPYTLFGAFPAPLGESGRFLLIQQPPPAAGAGQDDLNKIERAAACVASDCLSAAPTSRGDDWLLVRPTLDGGRKIVHAPLSGYAAPDASNFPPGLRARLNLA
jgi:hypothetical protein